eukprot:TRINITY_DN9566_c0_g1_i1.p1 TRINITY_DN9566_c0_g1~~TRINITY_DN9566_c0_g1_i1.p1  ORF type:complete len:434 (-),score=109.72 TRINITY_DN9566_c0_g1_i1:127-1428(-)
MTGYDHHYKVSVILGSQWGDEGKGKLVDLLASDFDLVARCAGGANAGHTIVVNGIKYALHLVPSGIITEKAVCLIGNGVVLHVPSFFHELDELESKGIKTEGRIKISDRAHLLFEFHKIADGLGEAELSKGTGTQIGTTKQGIGPCYSDKASRINLRVGDLRFFDKVKDVLTRSLEQKRKRFGDFEYDLDAEVEKYREYAKRLEPFIVDGVEYINSAYYSGKKILVEGANAALLDIDFGTYPYVTSSNCTVGGVMTGLGLSPEKIGRVIGVVKAYTTRVGQGHFPTELAYETPEGKILVDIGREFGTTTGRRRRVGWLDLMILKYSLLINGYTHLNLTKLDILDTFDQIKIGVSYNYKGKPLTSFPANLEVLSEVEVVYETVPGWKTSIADIKNYEDLPPNCKAYIERVEELIGRRFNWIGVGASRDAMITRN